MGAACSNDPEPRPTSSTTSTQVPDWVSQGGQQIFNEASQLTQQPYQPYGGPRVAGFSGDEKTGFQLNRDNVGSHKPDFDAARGHLAEAGKAWDDPMARGWLERSAREWDTGAAEQYMNPYTTGVTDIVKRRAQEDFGRAQLGRNASAVRAGAFGGSRHGVLDAEAGKYHGRNLADIDATGLHRAYETAGSRFDADRGAAYRGYTGALGAYNADRSAALGAAGGYGEMGQLTHALGGQDANRMMGQGALQRAQEQSRLDTAYGDFQRQQRDPYEKINFKTGVLTGVPYDRTTTTEGTQYVPQPSTVGQLAGLGAAATGAYQAWG